MPCDITLDKRRAAITYLTKWRGRPIVATSGNGREKKKCKRLFVVQFIVSSVYRRPIFFVLWRLIVLSPLLLVGMGLFVLPTPGPSRDHLGMTSADSGTDSASSVDDIRPSSSPQHTRRSHAAGAPPLHATSSRGSLTGKSTASSARSGGGRRPSSSSQPNGGGAGGSCATDVSDHSPSGDEHHQHSFPTRPLQSDELHAFGGQSLSAAAAQGGSGGGDARRHTTTLGGAAVPSHAAGVSGGGDDLRDTILFMQQQQSMQQHEVMSLLRRLLQQQQVSPSQQNAAAYARGDEARGDDGNNATGFAMRRDGGRGGPPIALDSFETPLMGAAYIASLPPVHAPPMQALRDSELAAARAKILQLEQKVALLEQQVTSKEATIRRLSDAALSNVIARVALGSSTGQGGTSSSGGAGLMYGGATRAVVAHKEAVTKLLLLGQQGSGGDHSPHRGGTSGSSFTSGSSEKPSQPHHLGGASLSGTSTFASPPAAIQRILQDHQSLCEQRLNTMPSRY